MPHLIVQHWARHHLEGPSKDRDNLVQIGHNVEVGENTVMAGQTGIAGSTKIGKNCMFVSRWNSRPY